MKTERCDGACDSCGARVTDANRVRCNSANFCGIYCDPCFVSFGGEARLEENVRIVERMDHCHRCGNGLTAEEVEDCRGAGMDAVYCSPCFLEGSRRFLNALRGDPDAEMPGM